jgi:hypothetical protein
MTTQKTTFEQFHEFVNAEATKNPERTIDNSCGWTDCAVGDFVREYQTETLGAHATANIMFDFDDELFDVMGSDEPNFTTYQELSEVLEEYGVENHDHS